jgi:hypothetical protein
LDLGRLFHLKKDSGTKIMNKKRAPQPAVSIPGPAASPSPTEALARELGTTDPVKQLAAVHQLQRLTFSLTITLDARDGHLDFAVLGGRGKPVSTGLILDILEATRRKVFEIERGNLNKQPVAAEDISKPTPEA